MCSNAIGPNLVADDPLTVLDESKTDSRGSSILNSGVYFDQVNLNTPAGLSSSYYTSDWTSCFNV